MPLRLKILISLVLIAVIPLAMFGVFAYTISTNNLVALERDALKSGLTSANRSLIDIQNNLARYLSDFTQWDDLHDQSALDQPDPEWIKVNFDPESPNSTFNLFNLDLLGMWNYDHKLSYSVGPTEDVAAQLGSLIEESYTEMEPQTRLISIGSSVFLVGISSIKTSDTQDPNGVLLFGRALGSQDTETITGLTGYDTALYKGTLLIAGPTTQRPEPDARDLDRAAAGKDSIFSQENADYALAYAPIQDEQGDDIATLVLWRPRTALQTSQGILQSAIAVAFVIGTLLAIVVALILGRSIISPLGQMVATVNSIAKGNFNQRIDIRKLAKDELLGLATAFNSMTGQLAQHIDELNRKVREIDDKNVALQFANAKAEESVRVRSEFMATMSHELRTPLNAIIGYSDVLLMGIVGPLNPVQTHQVERLKDNGDRLLHLINDVLDISRIESGRIEIAWEPFAPAPMIERIGAQMNVLAEQKQLGFTTTTSADLPPVLIGDEKRLEQIIVNLLSNAFKFTEKGAVTFNVDVSPNKSWIITVADTGIGIPPHALDLIFEPFRQVDGSSKRAFTGSGLGLAIAEQLIQSMGGKIGVSSGLGKGSTFTVTLPIKLPAVAEPSALQVKESNQ